MQKLKMAAVVGAMLLCNLVAAQQYCIPPQGSICESDKIMNVNFAGINNASGCSSTGYTDYTDLPAGQVVAQETYTISVTPEFGLTTVGVWIDYNHDKSFSANEFTDLGASNEPATLTATLTIPEDAILGSTRMRVKCQLLVAVSPGSSCSLPAWDNGETEDYAIMISGATAGNQDFSREKFAVYPNPAADSITIIAPHGKDVREVTVFNLSGQLVLAANNSTTLDVKDLAPGIYFVNILTKDGSSAIRFIKS